MPGTTARLRGYLRIFPEEEPGRSALAPAHCGEVLVLPEAPPASGVGSHSTRGFGAPCAVVACQGVCTAVNQAGREPQGEGSQRVILYQDGCSEPGSPSPAHCLPLDGWGVLGTVFPAKEASRGWEV